MEYASLDATDTEIEVLTTEHNVSHVYADSLYGVAYGNGYVQARDRMFQMDVLRHMGRGNVSSLLGASEVGSDIRVKRELYTHEERQRRLEEASDRMTRLLRGFSDGVNAKLVEFVTEAEVPGEFVALGHTPEVWKPEDTVAVVDLLVGYFGVDGGDELENARTLARLLENLESDEEAYDAYADLNWLVVPEGHHASLSEDEIAEDVREEVRDEVPEFDDVPDKQVEYAEHALDAEPWGVNRVEGGDGVLRRMESVLGGLRWGSNAALFSGEVTESGSPVMFGGPQMGYFKPPVLHEVGLHGGGFDVAGVGVVGTPGVVIGRTPEFAWTVTSGYDDHTDTVAVDLHPDDRHLYRWNGEWHEMEVEEVVHRPSVVGDVFGGEQPSVGVVEQELARVVEDGDRMPVVAWNPDERVAWCRRTTTRSDELDGVFSWAFLGAEDGLEGFEERLQEFPFSFNFHYADSENIAFFHTGKVPLRGDEVDHRIPVPAEKHSWEGTKQGLELGTYAVNPSPYIVNWNNAPVTGWNAGDVEGRWGEVHRVELLDSIVRRRLGIEEDGEVGEVDTDDVEKISAPDVEAVLREAAERSPVAGASTPYFVEAARDTDDERLEAAADVLESWGDEGYVWRDETDEGVEHDHPGLVIWEETRLRLQHLVFEDILGDQTPTLSFDPPEEISLGENEDPHAGDHGRALREVSFVRALEGETEHDWFDGRRDELIVEALGAACESLEYRFGSSDPEDWFEPGEKTRTGFVSVGTGEKVEIGMVNRGSWNQVVGFGDDGVSKGILPPSNSGHMSLGELVSSRTVGDEVGRLNDQLGRYERFEYKPFAVERDDVEELATRKERITTRTTALESLTENLYSGLSSLLR